MAKKAGPASSLRSTLGPTHRDLLVNLPCVTNWGGSSGPPLFRSPRDPRVSPPRVPLKLRHPAPPHTFRHPAAHTRSVTPPPTQVSSPRRKPGPMAGPGWVGGSDRRPPWIPACAGMTDQGGAHPQFPLRHSPFATPLALPITSPSPSPRPELTFPPEKPMCHTIPAPRAMATPPRAPFVITSPDRFFTNTCLLQSSD